MAYSKVTLNGTTIMDVTQNTVNASNLLSGETAIRKDGVSIIGEATGGILITKVITENGTYSAEDDDVDGYSEVTVDVPSDNREDLCEPLDVDFIDYDGRLLYSYTAQDFLALESLPPNPTNKGLIAQGWNWTLEDAKEFVGNYGCLVIGQSYTTDDGRTRIYIHVTPQIIESQRQFQIVATATVKNGLKIYWGDGTESTWTGGANANVAGATHTYSAAGDYKIEIEIISGSISFLGRTGAASSIIGGNYGAQGCVNRIEIGDNVTGFAQNTFKNMYNLSAVTVPITITTINDYDESMFSVNMMSGFVFPLGFTTNRYRAMFPQYSQLKYISIPKSMRNFSIEIYPGRLRKLTIYSLEPYSGTAMTRLYSAVSLTHFVVMGTYTTISDDSVRNTMVKKLYIPSTVTAISGITTFAYNPDLIEVHLRPINPPTLANSGAFRDRNANCIFYVPYSEDHSILEAYKTATNWSSFADYFQEEPQ